MMRAIHLLAGAAALALAAAGAAQTTSPKSVTPPTSNEAAFDAAVSSADQLAWLREMSSAPNNVGSPHDKANAEANLARFKSFGWDAHIETFQVLYPTPITTIVELVTPERIPLGG